MPSSTRRPFSAVNTNAGPQMTSSTHKQNFGKALPAWQRERAAKLHRICLCVNGRIARGQRLLKVIGWFAWDHRDKTYRADSTRRFRISKSTLLRLFHLWRRSGKQPDAFRLGYRSGREKLDRKQLIKFL